MCGRFAHTPGLTMKGIEDVTPFIWIPGQGIDALASQRLQNRYSRPSQPMGEAWFMGEKREMYTELLECEATQLSSGDVDRYLFEIASGVRSFGTLCSSPRHEWESWFLYFLAQFSSPQYVTRNHNWAFVPTLISTLMIFYPDSDYVRPDEPHFRSDILATLGRTLMEPRFWTNGEINIRHKFHDDDSGRTLLWDFYKTNELFSASIFLCWKYLRIDEIETWFRSVLQIESVYWRAQLLMWLLGAHSFFSGEVTQPAQLKRRKPNLSWEDSENLLDGFYEDHPRRAEPDVFLQIESIEALASAVAKHLSPELFFAWLDSFAKCHGLQGELLEMPEQFFDTFFS